MRNIRLKKLMAFCLAVFFSTSSFAFAEEDEPSEGQIAPDFSITTLDGKKFNLKDYRGKQAVYLVFWNTWCTYCMKKIPKLKHAQDQLSNQIKIIAVNTGLKDSVKKSLAFEKRFEINYPLAFDHGKKVTDLYG
ncbi:MAG: redoxin domain-containing protein, partial [Kangiellaceae bacterium]|nr:redoxin domain-containing protein [Kangiellaceae bacterium]